LPVLTALVVLGSLAHALKVKIPEPTILDLKSSHILSGIIDVKNNLAYSKVVSRAYLIFDIMEAQVG
jgi:hypothetical protein